jgi:hypothetical protein
MHEGIRKNNNKEKLGKSEEKKTENFNKKGFDTLNNGLEYDISLDFRHRPEIRRDEEQ